MSQRVVVTGGLGFIGSAWLRRAIHSGRTVLNLDARTYAADEARLPSDQDLIETTYLDITDGSLSEAVGRYPADLLIHFAAETHVTRSETQAEAFYRTNVEGTRNVLEAAARSGIEKVIHVSTDEVYGSAQDHPFSEDEKLPGEGRATSAYARSKAVADDLAREHGRSQWVVVVRPTNCFGPWQHPEKAIARWTARALLGQKIPVWGDGRYVRDWMFVDDVCSAIDLIAERVDHSDVFNIGPEGPPVTNLEIAELVAAAAGAPEGSVYLSAYDRPGHDRRYSVDSSKIRALGWKSQTTMAEGIGRTVEWYRAHRSWWEPFLSDAESLYADSGERK